LGTVIRKIMPAKVPQPLADQRQDSKPRFHPKLKVIHREGENILVG